MPKFVENMEIGATIAKKNQKSQSRQATIYLKLSVPTAP
jgi:hypothetical protein